MSSCHIEKITCPNCNNKSEFIAWDSINVDTDPDYRDKVKDRSIFEYTCEKCKNIFQIEYTTLYHDCTNEFMIWYIADENDDEIDDENNNANTIEAMRFLKDYKLRKVRSKNELVEKIIIFENNLDDCIIELIKHIIISKLSNEKTDKVVGIYFDEKKENDLIYEIVFEEGHTNAIIPFGVYEEIQKDYKINYPDNFAVVNISTVMNYFEM